MEAYTAFASIYDELMDNVPYEEWAERIHEQLLKYQIGKGEIVDLGCGTGVLTRLLSARGYQMTGVDLSPEMLSIASERSFSRRETITYVRQDMRFLRLPFLADAMISVCDSVNYLLEDQDLNALFHSVGRYLKDTGIFLFDFNTVHKYRDVIGDTTIAESREDCAFIWENQYEEETRINTCDLTLFVAENREGSAPLSQEESPLFRRYLETHVQRALTPEEVLSAAEANGFCLLETMDGEPPLPEGGESGRVFMVMGKKKAAESRTGAE